MSHWLHSASALALRVGAPVAVLGFTLSGCGDPAPDPAEAPIEVVLDGCELNRSTVAPGSHEVSVIGTGRLEILDASGKTVLGLTSGSDTVTLGDGEYTFVCETSGRTEQARLDSEPDG